ncbi:hypothetical protein AKO1_010398 [Acrasis kona]|uniref:Uncharacterized protein n=1 Tax=Acrasis kona TaxID=1008807 RepID=A0AAW2YXR5_9EUKA
MPSYAYIAIIAVLCLTVVSSSPSLVHQLRPNNALGPRREHVSTNTVTSIGSIEYACTNTNGTLNIVESIVRTSTSSQEILLEYAKVVLLLSGWGYLLTFL